MSHKLWHIVLSAELRMDLGVPFEIQPEEAMSRNPTRKVSFSTDFQTELFRLKIYFNFQAI